MRITVDDETGSRFSYDTDKNSNCLFPSQDEKMAIADALHEAIRFLEGHPVMTTNMKSGNA